MSNLFESIISTDIKNINPTIVFNEGWMARILMYFSVKRGISIMNIDLADCKNWTSEGLLSSPFLTKKIAREGYTHTDISFGDFKIEYSKRGEIEVSPTGKHFGVIEAKMNSNLSKGTKHFKEYNQGTRNIVCMAKASLSIRKINLSFTVLAPEKMIKKHKINEQIGIKTIEDQIKNRFSVCDEEKQIDLQYE